jgi:RNA polymerase sigma-70 factor (ECF subfamily)
MTSATDAFRTLYDANHERVRRMMARLVGPQNCDDLTQTVFAKAAKALPTFRGDAEASTWLYRIATNAASDWLAQPLRARREIDGLPCRSIRRRHSWRDGDRRTVVP